MKKYIDHEEKEIIESFEKGEWLPAENSMELKRALKAAAEKTMLKDQRMNIRIAKRDIQMLKSRAMEEGIPYQTLVSSVLHKYITGKLVEKG
jgi:predicted DNA binding CopG/RHH family protein